MIKLPPGLCANAVTAFSMSLTSVTRDTIGSTASERAIGSNGFRKNAPSSGAVLGLNMTATRVTLGATSLRIWSHFPINDGSKLVKPVMLPPGCGMLATKWLPTGSDTPTNTIGMVRVSCSSAAAAGVELPTRTGVQYDQLLSEQLRLVGA